MKKISLCVLLSLVCLFSYAQDQVLPVGDVKKVSHSGNQLNIHTTNAYVRIQACNANTIRVRISQHPFPFDFSYAIVANPSNTPIKFEESKKAISFHTDSIHISIQKYPFSIRFLTPDGSVINEDEPGLGTSWTGTEVTTYKHLQAGERFIGLGEKTGNLDRKGNGYTNWNSDVFGYSASADPLYATIPFYIGLHNGLQYGIFFDNSAQSDFNFGASNNRFASFGARSGEMNYYFIYQPDVAGIIRSYTALTGRMPMPPRWSLGYQQNRYSYYPDTEVYRIAQTLREKKIPADGITLDIHYMDAYKLFTWNKQRFPDPKGMIGKLKDMGFNTTLIVDPGIKVEKNYPAYESGIQENIFLKYSDGQPYTGEVWPGWCHFPDFTSVKGRSWWKEQITHYTNIGVNGIWNDMNEIATWGQKMPNNVLFDYDGHPTTHLKGHNVYGLQMARSSYEASRQALGKRPFILTRAGYAGLQRYSALWTGDNRAEDEHMLAGVRLISSLGLSGVPFSGMDVGGFTGNPGVGLYTRWMQLGAFIPYFRNHTQLNTKSAEPWTFGEDVLTISRNYINLRYRLLPYLYSTFYEASKNGMPVLRSLAIDYTHDQHIYQTAYQNQFLFGGSFLVIPQESIQQFAKIYLPAGNWYNLCTDAMETGNQEKLIELSAATLPVYVKGGSIVPMQSLVQHTGEKPTDTLTLHVYQGNNENEFLYYEDDGETYRYEQGDYYLRSISFHPAERTIVLETPAGKRSSAFRYIRLALHGFRSDNLQWNDQPVNAVPWQFSYLDENPLPGSPNSFSVKSIIIENRNDKMTIRF